jgi:hypothetical protein
MNRINQSVAIQVPTPLMEPGDGSKQTKAKPALYQTAVRFQPVSKTGIAQNTPALVMSAGFTAATQGGTITSAAAPAQNDNTLPNLDNMPFYTTGQDDSGGTTTLSEIMSYLGTPVSQADIDHDIKRTKWLAPDDMIDFAREHGLKAEGYNNGTWDEVKSMIDAGHPVQAMLDDGHDYINITGYHKDPNTGEESVVYHDPHSNTEQSMSVSEFETRWRSTDSTMPTPPTNYFIAYGDGNANLPPGRDNGIEGVQGVNNGVANFTNGLDRMFSPDSWGGFVHGVFEVGGSIPQMLVSDFGGIMQSGAQWVNGKVKGIPVLQNIVLPIGDAFEGVGAVLGDLGNGIGQSTDDLGGAFEDLSHGDGSKALHKVGDAAEDLGSGVVDAGKDVVSSVGNAIEDLFSW